MHYTTLQHVTVHCITLQYITVHYSTVRYSTLHYIAVHYITVHYITVHYSTIHYSTVQYSTLHYITLHYITVHYITSQYSTYTFEIAGEQWLVTPQNGCKDIFHQHQCGLNMETMAGSPVGISDKPVMLLGWSTNQFVGEMSDKTNYFGIITSRFVPK